MFRNLCITILLSFGFNVVSLCEDYHLNFLDGVVNRSIPQILGQGFKSQELTLAPRLFVSTPAPANGGNGSRKIDIHFVATDEDYFKATDFDLNAQIEAKTGYGNINAEFLKSSSSETGYNKDSVYIVINARVYYLPVLASDDPQLVPTHRQNLTELLEEKRSVTNPNWIINLIRDPQKRLDHYNEMRTHFIKDVGDQYIDSVVPGHAFTCILEFSDLNKYARLKDQTSWKLDYEYKGVGSFTTGGKLSSIVNSRLREGSFDVHINHLEWGIRKIMNE